MTSRMGVDRVQSIERDRRIYSVSEIAQAIRLSLDGSFSGIVVEGEISGVKRASSGHVYFDLKDAEARIKVALFKFRVRGSESALLEGTAVQVEGSLDFYAATGGLSLVAERVAAVGYGALQAQFDALKKKLSAEGLFQETRKRPLPSFPTRIGIVTSPTGAALHDMRRILRQRAPYARVILAPSAVQGEGAALEIATAIRLLNEWGQVDVIIAGRGGGSLQDLWAFNEEIVVRAIAESHIPIVSAVGHEADVTLADLAADLRAATPTHAAQQVVPDCGEVVTALENLSKHAKERLRRELREAGARLAGIRNHHALREPLRRVQDGRRAIDDASEGLATGLRQWVLTRRRRLEGYGGVIQVQTPSRLLERARDRLAALDHLARRSAADRATRLRELVEGRERLLQSYDYRGVLRRGYALVWSADGSRLIQRGGTLRPEERIDVQFEDAHADAQVFRVRPSEPREGS